LHRRCANSLSMSWWMFRRPSTVEMIESTALLQYLRAAPSLVQDIVDTFREELADLSSSRLTVLVFGAAATG
jgi:hypothetical protein